MPYENEKLDPRFLPGSISGLGLEAAPVQDPSAPEQMVVDTRYGIHLKKTDGCMIQHPAPGRFALAYSMEGTVGRTDEKARAMFILTPPMAALVARQLVEALSMRVPDYARELVEVLQQMVPERSPVADPPLVPATERDEPEESPGEASPPEDEPQDAVTPKDVLVATGRLGAGRTAA